MDFYPIYKSKVAFLILCLLYSRDYSLFKKIYYSIPIEYRKKHIIIRAIPLVIKKAFSVICNKIRKRIKK